MKYIRLKESDVQLSAITAGAWAIGPYGLSGLDPKSAIEAMRIAYDLDVTTIDTAPCYGLGYSEEVVAEAIKDLKREKIQLMTKCGLLWDETNGSLYLKGTKYNDRVVDMYKYAGKESIIEQCEKSLKRLKTDYIDVYLIHWPDVTTPIEESMEAMNLLKRQGKIRAAGLCNHSVEDIARASEVCPVAAIKDRYSMLYRALEDDILPYCAENNVAVMCYSVLQRGLLESTLLEGRPVPFTIWPVNDNRREVALFDPGNIVKITAFLKNMDMIAKDNGLTVAQLAIYWLLDQPGISVALLTAKDRQQLEHDVRVLDFQLSDVDRMALNDELHKLEEELAFSNLDPKLEECMVRKNAR